MGDKSLLSLGVFVFDGLYFAIILYGGIKYFMKAGMSDDIYIFIGIMLMLTRIFLNDAIRIFGETK